MTEPVTGMSTIHELAVCERKKMLWDNLIEYLVGGIEAHLPLSLPVNLNLQV